jgi:SAM-dependent methyltransferase
MDDSSTSHVADAAERWAGGLDEETGYWFRYHRDGAQGPWADDFAHRTNPKARLQPHVRRHIHARPGSDVRIPDVGSGPLTILGKRWWGRRVEIVAVDPLADRYAEAFERVGMKPLVRPVKGEAERLSDLFPPESFGLVHAQNCIDHGWDPLRAIKQMLGVVKPGGTVLLHHVIDEGEHMNYTGLHQWNFRAENGRFVIWRPGLRVDAHTELAKIGDIELDESADPGWLRVSVRRR